MLKIVLTFRAKRILCVLIKINSFLKKVFINKTSGLKGVLNPNF